MKFLPRCPLALVAGFCLSAGGIPSLHAQNLLINGSFEMSSGVTLNSTGYVAVAAGPGSTSTAITGWTATSGSSADANVYYNATATSATFTGADWVPNPEAGGYGIQLDSSTGNNDNTFTTGGSMAQTVSLNPGAYQLTFYYQSEVGANKGGDVAVRLSLSGISSIIGAVGTGPIVFDHNFTSAPSKVNPSPVLTGAQTPGKPNDAANGAAAATGWQPVTVNFTVATSGPVTLTLADVATTTFDNYKISSNVSLDNVVLTAIPEPSSVALAVFAGAGLLAVGRAGRNRRTA